MALNIGTKIENEGKNSQGRLSAAEFNQLIEVVKSLETNNVPELKGKLTVINATLEELKNNGGVIAYPTMNVDVHTGHLILSVPTNNFENRFRVSNGHLILIQNG